MNEKDDLNQEQDSSSASSNLPIEVKENKFKSLVEDLKDPMFFWNLHEGFKDFTDAVSMSGFAQGLKRAFNSVKNSVSNFTNKMKESAENKRNNDPSTMGLNVSTIEVQNKQPESVIIPTVTNTIVMAEAEVKSDSLVDHAKSAKDVELEATEEGIKLESLDIDEAAIAQDTKKKDDMQTTISAGEIVTNQPAKEEKEGEDR